LREEEAESQRGKGEEFTGNDRSDYLGRKSILWFTGEHHLTIKWEKMRKSERDSSTIKELNGALVLQGKRFLKGGMGGEENSVGNQRNLSRKK